MTTIACALLPEAISAQAGATVRVEENLRQAPNAEVLGRLQPGTPLSVVGRRQSWLEVVVEGWVWARSLQVAKRDGLDLVVAAEGGENLRGEPGGQIIGHLERGTLLAEVERRPGWIHVRRQAWIWSASVREAASGSQASSSRPTPPAPGAGTGRPGAAAASAPGGVLAVGSSGMAILSAPDGDTVAHADTGTQLEIIARQGSWTRVRLEGWTWTPYGDSAAATVDSAQVLTPEDLTRQPQAFRGRVVSWQLQFISLERAEKVRTDFFEGEPFLLTRFGGPNGPWVYVAVPTARVAEMRGLVPLDRIQVKGRVRTGASTLTGTPIIDLISLTRVGKAP
ncbi:MAG: SH3 domain-containing protein [Gemmatimonadetes bacterium]|nr:SH3 domain-containing protein [Gemmatimonadota bacterium]